MKNTYANALEKKNEDQGRNSHKTHQHKCPQLDGLANSKLWGHYKL